MHKIQLTYFKKSGKFYSSGDFVSDKLYMFDVFDEVKLMKDQNKLPDLQSGSWDGPILVNSETHPNAYPGLIL